MGKWKEFPYIQAFFFLSSKPSDLASFSSAYMFLAMPSKKEKHSTTILDPTNEPHLSSPSRQLLLQLLQLLPSLQQLLLLAPSSSWVPGHSNCPTPVPTFTPPITQSRATNGPHPNQTNLAIVLLSKRYLEWMGWLRYMSLSHYQNSLR